MSQYQNQYGAQTGMTDENGNSLNQLDQYGNPVGGGGFTGEAGRQHFGTTGGATGHGHGHGQQHHGVDQTTGHGTHTGDVGGYGTKPEYGSTDTGGGYGTGTGYGGTGSTEYGREEHHGDKKGVMDKIKEKIPGTEQSRTNTDGAGYGTTGQGYGTTGHGQQHHGVDQTTGHGTHTGDVGGYGTKPEYGSTDTGGGYGTGTGYGGTGSTEYGREEHHGDKKGVMNKIKEKIHGTEQSRTNTDGAGYGTTGQEYVREGQHFGTTGGATGHGHGHGQQHHGVDHGEQRHGEKKGIMEKIKEKLPGTGACTGH